MLRLSLATLLGTSVMACTDASPYMQISEAPGAIALERDPVRDWSTAGGLTSVVAPGSGAFPETVSLRVEGRRPDEGYETNDPLRSADVELIAGSACRISNPLTCMGGICFVELELSGLGLCQVRATAVTHDGLAIGDCWYRGTWEGDPADASFVTRMQDAAEAAHASCLAG